jgi:membrane dipeptidase
MTNKQDQDLKDKARKLHFNSIVVDTHADTISRMVDPPNNTHGIHDDPDRAREHYPIEDQGIDISKRLEDGHLDLPRIFEGGLGVQWWSCFVYSGYIAKKETVDRSLVLIDALKRFEKMHPEQIGLALTAEDCRNMVKQGKHAVVPCIEGGHAINDNLAILRQYWDLGVRYITLTHFNTNNWADSSTDAAKNNGLSLFGVEVVKEMNKLGMVVDVSHVSDKTFWDTIEVVNKPLMASHSSSWEICKHPRNMKDDMLKAVATNGGVVCVNFCPPFVSERLRVESENLRNQMWEEMEDLERMGRRSPSGHFDKSNEYIKQESIKIQKKYRVIISDLEQATLSDTVDHIDHMVKVAGIDHVGLGSDFDGIANGPVGLEDCTKFPSITEELMLRGYADGDIQKILGLNTMRVMEANIGK